MKQPKEYYAFISYKREDKKEAKRLQHALEYYRLPNHLRQENPELPEYVRPVFRDMTDLEVGELSAQIHAGLEQSHFLIVVCSPRAAASKWVNDEVEFFISLGKQDKIIPYIIEGVPHANNPSEECYPPALLNLSKEKELLGANINEVGKDSATIRVISRMFNIRFDTLFQRYQREQKKRRRQLIVAILLVFLFLSGIAGWILHQNVLLKEREWKMMENQARAVAEKANQLIDDGDLASAMMICMEIMPSKSVNNNRPLVPELLSSLYDAFYKYLLENQSSICSIPTIGYHNNDDIDFGIVPGNKYIWSCSESNYDIGLYDIQSGKLLHTKLNGSCYNERQFSTDGKYYVSVDEDENRIVLQEVNSGKIINKSRSLGDSHLWNFRFNGKNDKIFVEQDGVGIICFTIPSLDESYLVSDMPGYWYVNEKNNVFADFDSYNVWVGSKDAGTVLYEINSSINTCCFSDSLFAVSFSGDNWVYIYELRTGLVKKRIESKTTVDVMKFSQDMRQLMLINRDVCKMEVFDLQHNKKQTIALPNEVSNYSVDVCNDYLIFSSTKDNNAFKYVYDSDSLIHCTYFEAFPNRPYRVMRDGIQSYIKVFRAEPIESITTKQTDNIPYLIEGEGYCMIDDEDTDVRCELVCEISDSIALFVSSNSLNLVSYNKNKKHKNMIRRTARGNYNIPINLSGNKNFAVFTIDSLLFFDKNTLGLNGGVKVAKSKLIPRDLNAFKSSLNGEYIIRPENNDYCIYNTHGKVITTIDGKRFSNIGFSPTGQYLTCWETSSANTNLCVLSTKTSQVIYKFEQPISWILTSFDKNEKTFAFLYGRNRVAVFDIEHKKIINEFNGHVEEINDITLSPSGKYLLTTCPREGCVKLWDVETGAPLFCFVNNDINSVSFSEDEKSIIMSTHQGELEKYGAYAHSIITTQVIPFYPIEELLVKTKQILRNRQIKSDERKKYYLE